MSITLTYTFSNAEELQAHLDGRHDTAPGINVARDTGRRFVYVTTPAEGPSEDPVKKPAAPTASSPSGAAQRTTAPQEPAPEKASESPPAADAGEAGKTYTVDDAKALTMRIVADKGRDAAVNLLKQYNVPVAAKLPTDQIAAFCRDADEVLK